MKALDLTEVHNYSLGCLLYFDKICRKYNLKYSLAYGSLIGAIRHQGFIPWDDDVDVMMLRTDYQKLEKLFLTGTEKDPVYCFINENSDNQYYYLMGRICDKRTKIKFFDNRKDVDSMGVFIDIYPLDYSLKNSAAELFYRKTYHILNVLIDIANFKDIQGVKSICSKSSFFVLYVMLYYICKLIGSRWLFLISNFTKKIHDMLTFDKNLVIDYWDNNTYKDRCIYNSDMFKNLIDINFENEKIQVISCYDKVLTQIYGNYMKLPPEEDRTTTRHSYIAYTR